MPTSPDDTVYMSNPALPASPPARTKRESFDAIWAEKGWQIVSAETADGVPIETETPAKVSAPAASKGGSPA